MNYGRVIAACLMFLSGNFVYPLFAKDPNWFVAIERAFFQAIAMVFVIWVCSRNSS